MHTPLTDSDRAILEFEASAPRGHRNIGAKEEAIQATFGISPVRYYQKLNLLLDSPAALEQAPQLVRRLQRVREQNTP